MGANWKDHMILVRSAFTARIVEGALIAKKIPYRFIGGTKLMESAHVRDVLSVLRLVANQQDEIGWMRFLTFWEGVGDVTAGKVLEKIFKEKSLDGCILIMESEKRIPDAAINVVRIVRNLQNQVSNAVSNAAKSMEKVLSEKYKNQHWDKRQKDFKLVEKMAEKHISILAFIEEYLLDPIYISEVERFEPEDVITIITIHSAKGTECKVCYVMNVSPGAYPSPYAIDSKDEVEEERRVLYVALTRAKDELIVTRQGYRTWAVDTDNSPTDDDISTYFFNNIPDNLFIENVYTQEHSNLEINAPNITQTLNIGIELGFSLEDIQSVKEKSVQIKPTSGEEDASKLCPSKYLREHPSLSLGVIPAKEMTSVNIPQGRLSRWKDKFLDLTIRNKLLK